jgi:tetratricopeptide (TPR) repeat protein
MICDESTSIIRRTVGSERGQIGLLVLGWCIVIAIVAGVAAVYLWTDIFKTHDKDFTAANAALANEKWDQAVALFGKSLKSRPGNAAAYVGRARAYVHLGELDRALDDVNHAVTCDSGSAQALGQRGLILKLQGKNEKAVEDFARAVTLNPRYSWAYGQLADILMRKGELDKALATVNKALELKSAFVEGIRLRAVILTRLDRCRDAFEDFNRAEQLRPNDAMALQDKAWFLLTCPDEKLQDSGKAFEIAVKAFDLSEGREALVQETLAEAYFKQGDPAKAAELQKKAIELQRKKCPDGSCVKEMQERLQKYELFGRKEMRKEYEILPLDGVER